MELDHVNIKAPQDQLELLKDFYCSILDLEIGPRPNLSRPGFWLYAGDKAIIHLIQSPNQVEQSSDSCLDHFAIRKTGLNNFLEVLKTNDVEASVNTNEETQLTQVFFRDPCGVLVEVGFKN